MIRDLNWPYYCIPCVKNCKQINNNSSFFWSSPYAPLSIALVFIVVVFLLIGIISWRLWIRSKLPQQLNPNDFAQYRLTSPQQLASPQTSAPDLSPPHFHNEARAKWLVESLHSNSPTPSRRLSLLNDKPCQEDNFSSSVLHTSEHETSVTIVDDHSTPTNYAPNMTRPSSLFQQSVIIQTNSSGEPGISSEAKLPSHSLPSSPKSSSAPSSPIFHNHYRLASTPTTPPMSRPRLLPNAAPASMHDLNAAANHPSVPLPRINSHHLSSIPFPVLHNNNNSMTHIDSTTSSDPNIAASASTVVHHSPKSDYVRFHPAPITIKPNNRISNANIGSSDGMNVNCMTASHSSHQIWKRSSRSHHIHIRRHSFQN